VGVQIKLPIVEAVAVGADGGTVVEDEVAGVGCCDRNVKKSNVGCIAKLLIGDEFKHNRTTPVA
jgi:hypothetical protein